MSCSVTAHVTVNGDLGRGLTDTGYLMQNLLSSQRKLEVLSNFHSRRVLQMKYFISFCYCTRWGICCACRQKKDIILCNRSLLKIEEVKALFLGNKEGSTTCSITRTITDMT